MTGNLSPRRISTKLARIAELSRERPKMVWTTLAHNIDKDFLREAYHKTRKDGAPGIDGQTAREYGERLDENLESLLNRFKSGRYRAPAVRRVQIPKNKGKTRPIGIPTFEDKVLQRAVVMVLEAVYEQDFMECSYGFRPNRSAHQAVHALREELMEMGGGYVIDMDFSNFFDTLDHSILRTFLDKRIDDGVLRRTINKWLKAGVYEDGSWRSSTLGTPQGGVVSPLLANIYLHEVLDLWFEHMVKPRMQGRAFLVRYADDAVAVFELEKDARRVMKVLPLRASKYGLELHPEKTQLVSFKRPPYRRKDRKDGSGGALGSFDFLGFTFHWGRSQRGKWIILRRTAKDRLARALHRVNVWCKQHRHDDIKSQYRALTSKLKGHYSYYGISNNYVGIARFYREVVGIWRKWLHRRSRHARMTWEKYWLLLERYPLPEPRLVHADV